ncbi:hypothetical protein A5893_16020 [Pedobacter psychrophilus]|uniref:Uncharacterized protein n=1 Tax=Pedobacter psychrophilus TaxID=1826909 RepID=A0A179DBK0_9SPHI|nr:hypothetical protein [Pedobacter psychrophilus]OAQ38294.1 hypothetical protein A5893_16020 [Pedobacter psychrophilus]
MSEEVYLKQVIPAYFINQPEQVILRKRVKELIDIDFGYFYFNGESKVEKTLLFDIHDEEFYKINFESDILELRDRKNELKIVNQLKNFRIEFYISYGNVNEDYRNPVIMGIDELLYFLTKKVNDRIIKDISFPRLDYLEYNELGDDFISYGRVLINKYFPEYKGEVFNLFEIDNELKELFAVSSNSLAFLVRFKDRVKEELIVAKEYSHISNLNIYPRFNNAIAETAGYIYNIWERIIFILNEFFPKKKNKTNYPPSYEQYFIDKNKEFEIKVGYVNDEFLWFIGG